MVPLTAQGNETILLVEDDALVRASLELLLKRYGYEVVSADNGRAAMILQRAGNDFDDLADHVQDQAAFARTVRRVISDLELGEEENAEEMDADAEGEGEEQEATENEDGSSDSDKQESADLSSSEDQSADQSEGEEGAAEDAMDDMDAGSGEGDSLPPDMRWMPPNRLRNDPDQPLYRPYTAEFDEVIEAADLCDSQELTRLRAHLDNQLNAVQNVIGKLANRLQRKLMAKQSRSWQFDLDEGLLDSARLARVVVNPIYSLSYKQEKETEFRDTVVTLLIDNSGSMRGRPITLAAMRPNRTSRLLLISVPTPDRALLAIPCSDERTLISGAP